MGPSPAATRYGAYVIERELGRGGMGVVYEAQHENLGKRVAIKVLLAETARDPELVDRFVNEARAASSIEHPGIVHVFDVGRDDTTVYLVMELLRGESLASRLRSSGAMRIDVAIQVARQCANALEAAHRVGIVHRDLKPDNVFLVPDEELPGGERVKLLDFGVAKLVGDDASSPRTVTGAILGTPHYMSPEQCEGARTVDQRSDLYSLGCMLFQMVTGRLPFESPGIGGLIGMHIHVPPPKLRDYRPSAPAELEQLVAELLEKQPDRRIPSAATVAARLLEVPATPATAIETEAPTVPVRIDGPTMVSQARRPPAQQTTRAPAPTPIRRPRWTRAIVGGVAVAAIAAVVYMAGFGGGDSKTIVPDAAIVVAPVDAPTVRAELPVAVAAVDAAVEPAPDTDLVARNLRAKQLLTEMKTAFRKERYAAAVRAHDELQKMRVDDTLRDEVERTWSTARERGVRTIEADIDALIKRGQCNAATQALARAHVLSSRHLDAKVASCKQDFARAEHTKDVEALRAQIEMPNQPPLAVAGACRQLAAKERDRVPWDLCLTVTCEATPGQYPSLVVMAPADIYNRRMDACPAAKRSMR